MNHRDIYCLIAILFCVYFIFTGESTNANIWGAAVVVIFALGRTKRE